MNKWDTCTGYLRFSEGRRLPDLIRHFIKREPFSSLLMLYLFYFSCSMAQFFSFMQNTTITKQITCVLCSVGHIIMHIRISKRLLKNLCTAQLLNKAGYEQWISLSNAHVIPSWQTKKRQENTFLVLKGDFRQRTGLKLDCGLKCFNGKLSWPYGPERVPCPGSIWHLPMWEVPAHNRYSWKTRAQKY